MKQVYRIISTYSADVFGVCSALFELKGMVVIHDPSGCNSTYTTHDEPRWYDADSQIYITGFSEKSALFGDEDRLFDEIISTVNIQAPKFVCLIGSQMAALLGVDLRAVAKRIERAAGICAFALPTDSAHYYTRGIYMAMEAVAERFVSSPATAKNGSAGESCINILGCTPLDFPLDAPASMSKLLQRAGFCVKNCWLRGVDLNSINDAAAVKANLVVSYGGLGAARVLQRRYKIPYIVGVPWLGLEREISAALREASSDEKEPVYLRSEMKPTDKIFIIGESVLAESLAFWWEKNYRVRPTVVCPTETERWLLSSQALRPQGEDELKEMIGRAEIIVADPLYEPICPRKAKFIPWPHAAFSGRMYKMPNLFDEEGFKEMTAGI